MSVSDRKWDEDEVILPGFRFHPTDEELVDFYLRRKVANKQLSIELIKQVDIYKYEPWELSTTSVGADDQEWYFFCLRGRKYKNSLRPNRVTGSGFWKATGIDKPIYSFNVPHDCIGSAGRGCKTDWMMHEFRLPPQPRNSTSPHTNILARSTLEAEVWTVCRIFKRVASQRKYIPAESQQLPQLKFSLSSSLADTSSKTCSDESNQKNNSNKSEFCLSLADQEPIGQQNHYTTQLTSSSSSLTPSSSVDHRETRSDPLNACGFWNASGDIMFSAGDQEDELCPVVDESSIWGDLGEKLGGL